MSEQGKMDAVHGAILKIQAEIDRRDAAHKASLVKIKALRDEYEAKALALFKEMGQTSAKTTFGIIYTTIRGSASVKDPVAFLEYIKANGAYELLDVRANVTAQHDYIKEHKVPTPGVNWSRKVCLNVRGQSKFNAAQSESQNG